jgi:AcrR family transcriptional regulator
MNTREKFLKSALKVFSKKGYLGSTTKEMAREAGFAEVTLFRYFTSKEKLFEEVINTYSFLPALKGLLPKIYTMPFEDALTIIARNFLDTLTARKDLIRIMLSEIQMYPGEIHKIYNAFIVELHDTLASYFTAMQKKGVLRSYDVELGARVFLGMFFSYFNAKEFLMLKKYRTTDDYKVIKDFVSIFVRGTQK